MQTYLDIQAAVTKRFEKLVLVGYPDQGKVPTWGWGHTGPEVHVGQTITREQADFDFNRDQAIADAKLKRHVSPAAFAKLTEHEKAAVLDFVFNTGGGPEPDHKDCWTIWKDVEAGNLADVVAQFNRFIFVHVDGKPVTSNGLKNRRAAEIVLWNTGDQEAAVAVANAGGHTVSSGAIRALPTPPVTAAPKALGKTSFGLKVGALGTSAAGLAAKVFTPDTKEQASSFAGTVAEHAASFGHLGTILSSVAGASVVVIAAGMLFVHVTQQEAAKV
jgi:lysozyme